jgi:hypothetical protein
MEEVGQLHTPAALHPEETATGTHWLRGWVGSRVGLEAVEERKILPLPAIEPRTSSS